MKSLKFCIVCLLAVLVGFTADAKKYKWELNGATEVYVTGQGANRTQLVKAWAVAGSADKAIEKAKMDAVTAALFNGIAPDASTHGMGVANLGPLVKRDEYQAHEALFKEFFKKGEFLKYVREVNSAYPTGENNMKVDGGRTDCKKVTVVVSWNYETTLTQGETKPLAEIIGEPVQGNVRISDDRYVTASDGVLTAIQPGLAFVYVNGKVIKVNVVAYSGATLFKAPYMSKYATESDVKEGMKAYTLISETSERVDNVEYRVLTYAPFDNCTSISYYFNNGGWP